jgi:hypothetical protein
VDHDEGIKGTVAWLINAMLIFVLVAAAVMVAFVVLFVSWVASLTLVLIAGILLVSVYGRPFLRKSFVAIPALVLGLAGMAFLVPAWASSYQHDRTMSEVEMAACSVSSELSVTACEGGPVENPSNGNQCGYPVRLKVETPLDEEGLVAILDGLYGKVASDLDLHVAPTFVAPSDDGFVALVHFIGDEGLDLRCM